MPTSDRLTRQLAFLREIDRLKAVLRRTALIDRSRRENSAEHSWHLAVMAIVLADHAPEDTDINRVIRMLLVHDIVEVDAGDTYVYDATGSAGKAEREKRAADRLFGLLPEDQGREFRALWEELETGRTAEARFAGALDRLTPVLHNAHTAGRSWREHGITADRVIARNSAISKGSMALWEYARSLIEGAVAKGHLAPAGT